jgi:hypothetical protein
VTEGRLLYIHVERNGNIWVIYGVRPGTEGREMHGSMTEEIIRGAVELFFRINNVGRGVKKVYPLHS